MKKLLVIIYMLVLSFPTFGMGSDSIRSEIWCVNGYKFVYTWISTDHNTISVAQIMRNGKIALHPTECDGTEKKKIR